MDRYKRMRPSTPRNNRNGSLKTPSEKKRLKQATLMSFFKKCEITGTPTSVEKTKIKDIGSPSSNGVSRKAAESELFVCDEDSVNDSAYITANEQEVSVNLSSMKFDEEECEKYVDRLECSNVKILDQDGENSTNSRRIKQIISYAEGSDDDDKVGVVKIYKGRKRGLSDSDDEEDYVPSKLDKDNEREDGAEFFDEDDDELIDLAFSSAKLKHKKAVTSVKSEVLKNCRSLSESPNVARHSKFSKTNEERYQWLIHIKDAGGHEPGDVDYDPRTLYIPPRAWANFTPFEKQYWQIKSKMWDCIVFFKKGKFFELYEKDAHLGNQLFDLKIAGGGRANMQLAGIPEMSFDYWATQFIQHGYKVAKVDQCESMLAKEMREGNKGIVQRELQYILTSGTLTDVGMLKTDMSTYCLAVREEPIDYYFTDEEKESLTSHQTNGRLFGVAFIDTATGHIEMLEFEDDNECSQFETLMAQVNPKEVILEKNNLSNIAHKIVKFNSQPDSMFNYRTKEEFYGFEKTFDEITTHGYFSSLDEWPSILTRYYEEGKKVGFSAFGALMSYLQWLKLDQSLISMGQIQEYNPIQSQVSLVLDGVTLQNLEVFSNSFDNTDKGTLFKLLNHAITPMGKRTLRVWLMHPLLQKDRIEKRQESVELLLNDINLREKIETAFNGLPDLERLLASIHSGSLKIKNFDKVITGFEVLAKLINELKTQTIVGALKDFVRSIPVTLEQDILSWTKVYDRARAAQDGAIILSEGVESEFDESFNQIKALESELDIHLESYRKQFNLSSVQYKDCGKELYTIEVPISACKLIPSDWIQMSSNKSSKRYYSPEVRKLARSMAEAKELHKDIEKSLKSRLYKKFDEQYNSVWLPTIKAVANMDCILSLARASESLGSPACKPVFSDEVDFSTGNNKNGFLSFKELRHPCFNMSSNASIEFIPNDIELGRNNPQLGLLTGANAAGKSTVLRMTCVAVIMAQLGCYVPCEFAELTPVDSIMTRLGAKDSIIQGKSTFFVELSETKKILDMATNRSLLVLDELGRGGSSSDGFAIAEGVLHHLATHIQSLGFFATHYGALSQSFLNHPMVKPLKMSILIDNESKNLTFLYKLNEGQSEGSFGMHVASMCGIPKAIVDNAEKVAQKFEYTSRIIIEKKKHLKNASIVPLGLQSDIVRLSFGDGLTNTSKGCGEAVRHYTLNIKKNVLKNIICMIDGLDAN